MRSQEIRDFVDAAINWKTYAAKLEAALTVSVILNVIAVAAIAALFLYH